MPAFELESAFAKLHDRVRERSRERESEREGGRKRGTDRERERERERTNWYIMTWTTRMGQKLRRS